MSSVKLSIEHWKRNTEKRRRKTRGTSRTNLDFQIANSSVDSIVGCGFANVVEKTCILCLVFFRKRPRVHKPALVTLFCFPLEEWRVMERDRLTLELRRRQYDGGELGEWWYIALRG